MHHSHENHKKYSPKGDAIEGSRKENNIVAMKNLKIDDLACTTAFITSAVVNKFNGHLFSPPPLPAEPLNTCVITGVQLPEALEAAHITPVEYKGNDSEGNGLCHRLDIHRLFDTSNLIIILNGDIHLTRVTIQS